MRDKIPNPIRWILVIVILFLIPLLINEISKFISVVLIFYSYELSGLSNYLRDQTNHDLFFINTYIFSIISLAVSILAAGWMAPKYKFRFVLIVSSFYLICSAIVLIMNTYINIWSVFSVIIGSFISIIIAKKYFK